MLSDYINTKVKKELKSSPFIILSICSITKVLVYKYFINVSNSRNVCIYIIYLFENYSNGDCHFI